MGATSREGVQSTRGDRSTAAPSTPIPEAPTMSALQAEEDDVVPVTGPITQLQAYSSEFVGLMRSWSRLLNQDFVFNVQLRVSKHILSFPAINNFQILILEIVICSGHGAKGLCQGPKDLGRAHQAEGGAGHEGVRVGIYAEVP